MTGAAALVNDIFEITKGTKLRLILVRHGESIANLERVLQGQTGGELTENGRRQAEKLGAHLHRFRIDWIIVSDLNRTRQTAAPIIRLHDAPVEYSPDVREWNVGDFDGKLPIELDRAIERSGENWLEFRPNGGERLLDVYARAEKFIDFLVKEHNEETVLLVSHGDFLRMVLAYMLDTPLYTAVRQHLDNTSITVADLTDGDGWQMRVLNDTSHL